MFVKYYEHLLSSRFMVCYISSCLNKKATHAIYAFSMYLIISTIPFLKLIFFFWINESLVILMDRKLSKVSPSFWCHKWEKAYILGNTPQPC